MSILKDMGCQKKNGVLVYVGLHRGEGFDAVFRNYELCYGFEANPELFAGLQIRFRKYPNVRLFNVAVAAEDGEIDFNISSNDGTSSSIGHFNNEWENYKNGKIRMEQTIRISSINLLNFLRREEVGHINTYISDIQGFDLQVLKSLGSLIENKRISTIMCEVSKDKYKNIYQYIPDNSQSGFAELLNKNYEFVAKGWGHLNDGEFNEVPEDWWEMDCKWKVKSDLQNRMLLYRVSKVLQHKTSEERGIIPRSSESFKKI